MTEERVRAVLVASDSRLAHELIAEIGISVTRLSPERLTGPEDTALDTVTADRVVWLHLMPAARSRQPAALGEAELLLRSASLARASARGASLTFICLLPAHGLFEGDVGSACELGRGAMCGLIKDGIGEWSAQGERILGVVYAGLDGHDGEGRRPVDAVRSRTPMGRSGSVSELADAVRYLGSSSASYVTGTFLHVDGGWRAYSWIYPARTF